MNYERRHTIQCKMWASVPQDGDARMAARARPSRNVNDRHVFLSEREHNINKPASV
jgi:hypothetical protein